MRDAIAGIHAQVRIELIECPYPGLEPLPPGGEVGVRDMQEANRLGAGREDRDVVAAQCEPVALDQRRVADARGTSGGRDREESPSTHDPYRATPAAMHRPRWRAAAF